MLLCPQLQAADDFPSWLEKRSQDMICSEKKTLQQAHHYCQLIQAPTQIVSNKGQHTYTDDADDTAGGIIH